MLRYESVDLRKKYMMTKIEYPISVYMKITTACTLKCDFCSQEYNKKNKINQDMDFEKIRNILKEMKKIGVVYIYYTGGEPLMHKDIKLILKYGYELGFKQFLVSNGFLFTNKRNIELTQYLMGVGISLHGKPELHNKIVGNINCFNTIIENLKVIKEKNKDIQININCTATNNNINKENLEYLAQICKENEWRLTVARLNYIGKGLKHKKIDLNNMLEIINNINQKGYEINISNCVAPCTIDKKFINLTHGCGAGLTIAAIEANGDVKICASSNIAIGNLNKKSFKRIWKSYKLKKYRKLKWIPMECRECKYFTLCKGGCKAELTGEYWKKSCDATLEDYNNRIWRSMKNKKIKLNFNVIRKEKHNKYLIIGLTKRVCNNKCFKILRKIDGEKTANEIVNEDENIKKLLINLLKDGLVYIKE